jgi:hypothetical protein
MSQEKSISKVQAEQDEIAPHQPGNDYVPANHLDLDKETAAYVGNVPTVIDEATNKRLFWTVNRRILACMLGVSNLGWKSGNRKPRGSPNFLL